MKKINLSILYFMFTIMPLFGSQSPQPGADDSDDTVFVELDNAPRSPKLLASLKHHSVQTQTDTEVQNQPLSELLQECFLALKKGNETLEQHVQTMEELDQACHGFKELRSKIQAMNIQLKDIENFAQKTQ